MFYFAVDLLRAVAVIGLWKAGDVLLHATDLSSNEGLLLFLAPGLIAFVVVEVLRGFESAELRTEDAVAKFRALLIVALPIFVGAAFLIGLLLEWVRDTFSTQGVGTALLASCWLAASVGAFVAGLASIRRRVAISRASSPAD